MGTIVRVGGMCGILSLVLMVIVVPLSLITGVAEEDLYTGAVDKYLPAMAQNQTLWVVSLWLINVVYALLVVFGAGLFQALQRVGTGLRIALLGMVGAALAFFVAISPLIAVAEGVAPAYVASGGDKAILGVIAQTLVRVYFHMAWLAGLLLGAAALVYGGAMLRTQVLPRWPAYLALVGGVLGILGTLGGLAFLIHSLGFLGFWLLLLWAAITGVTMIRTPATQGG